MSKKAGELTTAELVAEYNAATGKNIKKFESRAVGVKKLIEAWGGETKPTGKSAKAPKAPAAEKAPAKAPKAPAAAKPAKEPKAPKAPKEPKETVERSVAIARSWQNQEVKLARSMRYGVKVQGEKGTAPQDFGSVAQAFRALKLPINAHIKFRGELVANKKAEINGFKFTLVPKQAAQ